MIVFSQLEGICRGKNLLLSSDRNITSIFSDSRKPVIEGGSLFFAIKGAHHDGHAFLSDLYELGVRQFVVEFNVDVLLFPQANIILVDSSIHALQQLVAFHRQKFDIPIVGITGSNGKTIVKEWLYHLLSERYNVVKNPGSYNSQLGVPLSLWQIGSRHDVGIFEAGISKPEEMQKLGELMKPSIGVFTNIGSAHDEGFASMEQKVEEKLKLFQPGSTLIFCADHTLINKHASDKQFKLLRWGVTANAEIRVRREKEKALLSWNGKNLTIRLPFTDAASIENCMHCVAVMMHFGFNESDIQHGVDELRSVPMRLELKEGINQCHVIDDSYNNDLAGLRISLDFLSNQHQRARKRLILSDIFESGLKGDEFARYVAEMIRQKQIHSFIGIGKMLSENASIFGAHAEFFKDTEDFISRFDFNTLHDEVILVKGARKFHFEKIINRLQRKVHGTVMEIDLGAIVHNLNVFRAKIKSSTKLMVMVKAFAYGSGSTEIANVLQYHKVNYLGVAYADEGVELRKNNIGLPIMVMNPSEESFSQIIAYNLEPEVYSFKILHALLNFLGDRKCPVHIKLDTGMHRLGFEHGDIPRLCELVKQHSNLRVASIFTHLAGADEKEHDEFSRKQATDFVGHADQISKSIGYKPIYHALNSPGILRLPELQMDMVRLGIGLYGVDPTPYKFEELKPVATLKTIVSQIKQIPAGETIGYSRRGKAEEPMTLATIAIGYADGYSRSFSRGVGEVLIRGKRAKVIGNVCMDMTMVDITGLDVHEGDEVTVFGDQLTIQEVAAKANTIPYEILTNTSERVKRVFVAESM